MRQQDRSSPLSPIRKLIADRMRKSKDIVADITLTTEVDMSACAELRERLGREGSKVSYTALFVAAVAQALGDFPDLNSSMEDAAIVTHGSINICVAVDTPDGVVAPVIRSADSRSVVELEAEIKRLAERAKTRSLSLDNLTGGTFTVSNLGAYGVDAFTPIVTLPQCAILGIGRIVLRPVVAPDGAIVPRPLCVLSLTCDHRIVDGAPAARFLGSVKQVLESGLQRATTRS